MLKGAKNKRNVRNGISWGKSCPMVWLAFILLALSLSAPKRHCGDSMGQKASMGQEDLKNIEIKEYSYVLPEERIAKFPLSDREASRLLVYERGEIREGRFGDVRRMLKPGQMLVFNNTKVIHARLFFQKGTGGRIEVFCLEPYLPADYAQNFAASGSCEWSCMVGNLKKWREGEISCAFEYRGRQTFLKAVKSEVKSGGEVIVRFSWEENLSFSEVLECCGRIPIPPYLGRDSEASDEERYQTVYSKEEGSVAAPTAGLHFTESILEDLKGAGVNIGEVTLHVGAGTFRPVKAEKIGEHDMHTEHIVVSKELVKRLRDKTGDVVAVGTTSVRTLESLYWMGVKCLEGYSDFGYVGQWECYGLPGRYTLAESMDALAEWFGRTGEEKLKVATTILILPGYRYRVVDALFTNFHQPQSTLLLLVAAAVGEDWKKIYGYALAHGFRFLSYGDGSLLWVGHKK